MNENLKNLVKQKYGEIAIQNEEQNRSSCCSSSGCGCGEDYTIFSEDYTGKQGYNPDADLGLGCGIPTEFAQIKEGDTVVDLGSGAGNDCFIARSLVGESGYVIGIDFTKEMVDKAKQNAEKLKFSNVEFRFGDIEKMPLTSSKADVVISNCVLNLVPDKVKAFSEIFRILKPGGHFSVSDVVLKGILPAGISDAAEMYVGCVSGAIQLDNYLEIMKKAGFISISIQKQKPISIPDGILVKYLQIEEINDFRNSEIGIFSVTVYAEKPRCTCSCNC